MCFCRRFLQLFRPVRYGGAENGPVSVCVHRFSGFSECTTGKMAMTPYLTGSFLSPALMASNYAITTDDFGRYHLTNRSTHEEAVVIPEQGGMVYQLRLVQNGKLHDVLDFDADPEVVKKNSMYKGTFLAPFPNRTANGVYNFQGRSYELPINEVPR